MVESASKRISFDRIKKICSACGICNTIDPDPDISKWKLDINIHDMLLCVRESRPCVCFRHFVVL